MTNKNGFWIVICNNGGESELCYDEAAHGGDCAQFNSEETAQAFVESMRVHAKSFFPKAHYYWKYIPWGEFA